MRYYLSHDSSSHRDGNDAPPLFPLSLYFLISKFLKSHWNRDEREKEGKKEEEAIKFQTAMGEHYRKTRIIIQTRGEEVRIETKEGVY